MKKTIINLSLVTAVAIGFSGCFGGGGLEVPVTKRTQNVDAQVMKTDVKDGASKSFTEGLKQDKYKNQTTVSLKDLKNTNKDLYDLILPLAKEAQKMYTERALSEDITKAGAQWLVGDVETLNITLASTGGSFNGRYSPFNDLLILNVENNNNKELAQFLVAHELAHAISLHVSEDKTNQAKMLAGAEDAANVGLDVALNKAYLNLLEKDKKVALTIDEVAKELFTDFYSDKDLADEKKIVAARKDSFAAKAAIKAKQLDKLELLGIDLKIPLKTKMVLKHLVLSGLDATGALDALKGGVDFASANVLAISGHPKTQEMEADSIALELTKRAGLDTKSAACKRFAGEKDAGMFDSHPSYKDRRDNLGCDKK